MMGMYDSVRVRCPECGVEQWAQSKSGDCRLEEYELDTAPDKVLEDVNRHAPFTCNDCKTVFDIHFVPRQVWPRLISRLATKKSREA